MVLTLGYVVLTFWVCCTYFRASGTNFWVPYVCGTYLWVCCTDFWECGTNFWECGTNFWECGTNFWVWDVFCGYSD